MEIQKEIEKIDTFSIKNKTKGRWFELVIANVIVIVFVALGIFTPLFSIALGFIVMAYLQVGLYGFVLKTYRGDNPDYKCMFLPIKYLLNILFIKIITIAGIIIWGLLFFVPGIIFGLNCSFAGIIYFENPEMKTKDVFNMSKKMVDGERFQIFMMALVCILLCCIAASVGVGLYYLFELMFIVPLWLTILLIVLPTVIVLIIVSLPLFEIYLIGAYENAKKNLEQTKIENQDKNKTKKVSK